MVFCTISRAIGATFFRQSKNATLLPSISTSNRSFCAALIDKFQEHCVNPDVIQTSPKHKLELKYQGVEVNFGNVMTPTQVQKPPTLHKWPTESGALYTLIMTDPDAPSRQDPKFREWHHWLVVNIPGTDVDKGDTLSEYVGSGPPEKTGLHRYVFLVYKQKGRIVDNEHGLLTNRSGEKRGGWKTLDFVTKHKLIGPVAGNFYQAEWDTYVPKLYEQLSGK